MAVFALCEEIELETDSAAVMVRRTAVVIMAEMAPLGFQLPSGRERSPGGHQDDHNVRFGP
jgi:hypothetical protein